MCKSKEKRIKVFKIKKKLGTFFRKVYDTFNITRKKKTLFPYDFLLNSKLLEKKKIFFSVI